MDERTIGDDGVTRRDILHGAGALALAGMATGAKAAPPPGLIAQANEPGGYYPPLRQGMRGSHPGAFELAHALRDGEAVGQALAGPAEESYDLIIVGGGISGLAAAQFYCEKAPGARVLILDNHDDFGGHAKRNQFVLGPGRVGLMNGGTLEIESPRPYSAVADGLLRRIGIDVSALVAAANRGTGPDHHRDLRLGDQPLTRAVFFDRESFGRDALVPLPEGVPLATALTRAPLSPAALAQIVALEDGRTDPLAAMTADTKKQYLSTISYRDYLLRHGRLGEEAYKYYQAAPLGWWTVGSDGIAAIDAWGIGFPGFKALALPPGGIERMGFTPRGYADTGGSATYHFPDGNATIARMLVAKLVPGFLPPGCDVAGSILTEGDYGALDRAGAQVRIRLSATALRAANRAGAGADVVYAQAGANGPIVRKAAARHVVMAGWNMMIPYLVPDLPAEQKAALHELVKDPICYVSVALANARAFARAGIGWAHCPGAWYHDFYLDQPTEIGGYRGARSADEPALLRLTRIPHTPGLSEHDQARAGRVELLAMEFATFEANLRDLLNRALGPHGFDAARDITAITVNRWPHGYAPEFNPLWDKLPTDDPRAPNIIGRRQFGAIAIANADAGRAAYTDVAIDQAWRAVGELLG